MKYSTNKLAFINPALLVWAREYRGFDVDTAAKKIGVKSEKLQDWESGKNWPTFSQLEKLALIVYKRPTAVFFRKTLPPGTSLTVEFRTLKSNKLESISPETRLAIQQAKYLQNLHRELLLAKPSPFNIDDFVLDTSKSVQETAADFRSFLGLEFEEQKAWKDHYAALNALRAKLEESGIGVFQLDFPIEDARGFALYGNYPVLILNEHDAPQGRIFSLIHETCHILLKVSSMIFGEPKGGVQREYIQLEKFCNDFAGEFLLPKEYFLPVAKSLYITKDGWTDNQLNRLANLFKTSKEVVLRRLVHHGCTTNIFYGYRKKEWDEKYKVDKEKERLKRLESDQSVTGGGMPSHKKVISSKGTIYIGKVLNLLSEGRLSQLDAYRYLGLNAEQFPKMIELMSSRV